MGKDEFVTDKSLVKRPSKYRRVKRIRCKRSISTPIRQYPISTDPNNILSLPVEIILLILSYLTPRDLQTLKLVCTTFEHLTRDPFIWKAYEALCDDTTTSMIIHDLKNMPFIKKINICNRTDCNAIIKQLSRSNKQLEEIHISFMLGEDYHLQSAFLIRLLRRCEKLHTIIICGARVFSLKFYQILGCIGYRLKSVSIPTTCKQFRTLAKHMNHIEPKDREIVFNMGLGGKMWEPMQYCMISGGDQSYTVLISYLYSDFLVTNVSATPLPEESF